MTEQEAKVNNSGNSPYIKNSQNTETETCEKCLYIKSQCKCNKSEINASCISINEAQEYLLNRYLVVGSPVNPPKEECEMHNVVLDMAIKALEEVQQYRALGLTPELIEAMQGHNIAMINDLAEYQALGTVEELRVARDKQVAKPITNADRIRQMTDEELAEFLLKVNTAYAEPCMVSGGDCKYEDYPTHDKGCKDCFLEYLRKEVEKKDE